MLMVLVVMDSGVFWFKCGVKKFGVIIFCFGEVILLGLLCEEIDVWVYVVINELDWFLVVL